ncbi:MAG: putative Ig domain-containing protein [Granulosicoccus sp.]
MNTRKLWLLTTVILSCLIVGGCDWVDSGGSSQAAPVVITEILLDDVPIGEGAPVNEQSIARITARHSSAGLERTYAWSEMPLEQGNLPECAEKNGFNTELAARTLAQACTSPSDCSLGFIKREPVPGEQTDIEPDVDPATQELTRDTEFDLRIPTLQASIGVRYALVEEDSSGNVFNSEYSFCLIAINEAPDANDDTFSTLEGTVLNVTLTTVNLLTNDSDDIDVSNADLSIVPEPLVAPEHAAFFELGNDGSFTYESSLVDLREDQLDGFEYELTDGVFTSTARVTIRVAATNEAPRILDPIAPLSAVEDDPFSVDLAPNFRDPEGGNLTFTLSPLAPLATGSGLMLSRAGVLSGTPTTADVGEYELILRVSDGGRVTDAPFTLVVAATSNRAPVFVAGSIEEEVEGPRMVIMRITPRFSDPDGDRLTYSMAGDGTLPDGLSINRSTGIISGRPRVIGIYEDLRVRATDPDGASALSSVFTVSVTGI